MPSVRTITIPPTPEGRAEQRQRRIRAALASAKIGEPPPVTLPKLRCLETSDTALAADQSRWPGREKAA